MVNLISSVSMLSLMGQTGGDQQGEGNFLVSMLPFILIIGVIYFLMIRPQQKKTKEKQKLLSTVDKGDRIVTVGGIHGEVLKAEEKTLIVKIDDKTKVELDRASVSAITKKAS